MSEDDLEKQLAQVERDITTCQSYIERQRQIITQFGKEGLNTVVAKRLLAEFEATLAERVADRDRLVKERAANAG